MNLDPLPTRIAPAPPVPASSRLLMLAQPNAMQLRAMQRALAPLNLTTQLGDALLPPACWHQALSDPYVDSPATLQALVRAGDRVRGSRFVMTLDRFGASGGGDAIHWSLKSSGRAPDGLAALLAAIRQSLLAEGLEAGASHTPHVTVSYRAPGKLPTLRVPPVRWLVDEILLARGGHGHPFRYDVLTRWPLQGGEPSLFDQAELF
jgi:2'-5' RNA ligase